MKALLITAPSSGSGKTTVTMGLIRALTKKGLDVCGYKIGPDYIDCAFLEAVSGKPAGNLDLHLQGENGIVFSLSQASSDYCLFEGVMGYFDGISNTSRNSSYYMTTLILIGEITPFVLSLSKHEMSLFDKLRANGESTPLTHSTCQI